MSLLTINKLITCFSRTKVDFLLLMQCIWSRKQEVWPAHSVESARYYNSRIQTSRLH
nr:MAG TPA: hypothetical protein [Caudoviricetes sp.]DAN68836.1 MAG TPA: hypothetical protein [Caudoviricetes sp.]DAV22231.1 MAG TPA: hypothetical protein [Caudoviricetes sp.]DAX67409.1 MAG TPA: hypothetical protein [Caudoviricetes sp.]